MKKIWALTAAILFVLILVGVIKSEQARIKQEKDMEALAASIVKAAKWAGLEDVSVRDLHLVAEYEIYEAAVESSNFSSLTTEEMLDVDKKIDSALLGVCVYAYWCDDDVYKVYHWSRSVYKNSEEVYNDYYNSELYRDHVETAGICRMNMCRNKRHNDGKYCTEHECAAFGCSELRKEGSSYCKAHQSYAQTKPNSGGSSHQVFSAGDPYGVENYDNPEDFADDMEYDFDEGWEEAYEYWEYYH